MKKICAASAALLIALSLSACGGSDNGGDVPAAVVITESSVAESVAEAEVAAVTDSDNSGITCAEIAQKMLDSVEMSSMAEVGADRISNYLNVDGLADGTFSMFICGSGGFADEAAVFDITVNDEDSIREAIEKRLESRKKDFEDYNPDEYDKLCEAVIETHGNYLIFVVSSDNSTVISAVDSIL